MSPLRFGQAHKPVPYFRMAFHLRLISFAIVVGVLLASLEFLLLQPAESPPGQLPWSATQQEEVSEPSALDSRRELATAQGAPDTRPASASSSAVTFAPGAGSHGYQVLESLPPASPAAIGLPRRLSLSGVEDNRRVVPSEWDEWLRVFHVLKEAPVAATTGADVPRGNYVQLMAQPQSYRGQLIKLAGFVRRAHRAQAPKNQWTIQQYHQLWLQVDDHRTDPVAVWCLDLPPNFPLGMEIEERAEVIGYFFKVMTYVAGDGTLRRAPLVLAKTVLWQQRPVVIHKPRWEAVPYVVLSAVIIAVLATMWIWWRTRPKTTPRHREDTVALEARQSQSPLSVYFPPASEPRASDQGN